MSILRFDMCHLEYGGLLFAAAASRLLLHINGKFLPYTEKRFSCSTWYKLVSYFISIEGFFFFA